MKKPLVIGLDLGGTWLRLLVLEGNGRRFRSHRAAAVTLERLPSSLNTLWRNWGIRSRDVQALVLASRGVWSAKERMRQEKRLGGLARRIRVISDVEAAYRGALGDRSGILLLAGTGSIALGRGPRGQWVRRGGMGPFLGDEGSAFWIGREHLRTFTRGEDFDPVLEIVRSPNPVARIAALAPHVLHQAAKGNRTARRIVKRAQHHLAELVLDLVRSMSVEEPIPLSWAGSLLEDEKFRAGVCQAARRSGLRFRLIPPHEPPALAAAHLALNLSKLYRP